MPRYLIDANLPRWFSLWNSAEYVHQHDIDLAWHDVQIWEYAKQNGLTIVTKDSDFSSRILLLGPPPKVIHIRLGNMDMRGFHEALDGCWAEVLETSASHKLVVVYENRIHAIV